MNQDIIMGGLRILDESIYKLSNEINGIDKIMGFKHTTVKNRFSMTAGIGLSIHVRIKHFNFVTNYC